MAEGELYRRKSDNAPVRAQQWKINEEDLTDTWKIIDGLVEHGQEIMCDTSEILKDRLFWQMTSIDAIDWKEGDYVVWDGAKMYMVVELSFERNYEKVG